MNAHFASALVTLAAALLMLIIVAAATRPQPWDMAPRTDSQGAVGFAPVVER